MLRKKLHTRCGTPVSLFAIELKTLLPRLSINVASFWKLPAKSIEPILIYASVKKRDVSLSR